MLFNWASSLLTTHSFFHSLMNMQLCMSDEKLCRFAFRATRSDKRYFVSNSLSCNQFCSTNETHFCSSSSLSKLGAVGMTWHSAAWIIEWKYLSMSDGCSCCLCNKLPSLFTSTHTFTVQWLSPTIFSHPGPFCNVMYGFDVLLTETELLSATFLRQPPT